MNNRCNSHNSNLLMVRLSLLLLKEKTIKVALITIQRLFRIVRVVTVTANYL